MGNKDTSSGSRNYYYDKHSETWSEGLEIGTTGGNHGKSMVWEGVWFGNVYDQTDRRHGRDGRVESKSGPIERELKVSSQVYSKELNSEEVNEMSTDLDKMWQ